MDEAAPITKPIPDATNRPYWDGLVRKKLLVQRCRKTGLLQWYPRIHSVHAPGAELEWIECSGKGTIYTYSIIRTSRVDREVPYVIAIIALAEGPLIMANIIECDIDNISIGMAVEAEFVLLDEDITMLQFRPAIR